MKILSAYPAGNPSPEYVVQLTAKIASYPAAVIVRLADMREGLPAKSKFLPSIAEVHEIAERIADQEERRAKYAAIPPRRPAISHHGHHHRAREPFRPFPKLWAAFAEEPQIIEALDHGGFTFDQLDRAGRLHAMQGTAHARDYIIATAKINPVAPAHHHKGQDHAPPDTGDDATAA